jgi:hypothetical protein
MDPIEKLARVLLNGDASYTEVELMMSLLRGAIDQRIDELGHDQRLWAKDNHCGHGHQVVLKRGF